MNTTTKTYKDTTRVALQIVALLRIQNLPFHNQSDYIILFLRAEEFVV